MRSSREETVEFSKHWKLFVQLQQRRYSDSLITISLVAALELFNDVVIPTRPPVKEGNTMKVMRWWSETRKMHSLETREGSWCYWAQKGGWEALLKVM